MKICRRLRDLFSFPGFIARTVFKEVADDSNVGVMTLRRQKKQQSVRAVGIVAAAATISARIGRATYAWRGGLCMWSLIAGACNARGAVACT